ncbi:MAG: tetratricopeptide repeat protein, partial [Proteobacteria bacterium]|nr:tetratricopeptide repeat protein [Pseudomonadota bacterium]
MLRILYLLLIFGALLATGCAVSPDTASLPDSASSAPVATKSAAKSTTSTPDLPEGEFPPQVLYQLLVAELAGQRGEMGAAVANYLAAAKESQDPNIAERAARIAAYSQALREALDASLLWVKLAPENPEARQMAASLLLAFGRAPEAVVHFEQFIVLSTDKPNHGFMLIAGQLARDKNAIAALSVMDKLIEKRGDDPHAWLAYGQLALRQARLGVALESANKALALKKHWASAVVLRARVLSLQGDKEGAIAYLEQELDGELKKNIAVGVSHARLLTETKQLDKAHDEFERLAEQEPDNAEVNYAAGVLALQLKDLDKAEQRLKQVLSLGQRMLEANYYLGRIYEEKEDPKVALRHYFAVRHGEYYLSAQSRAASLLADQGKLDRAREHLHSLRIANQEEQVRIYLVEGELLRKAEKFSEAFDFLTEKVEKIPDDTALRYARALIAEKLDKLDLAEGDLRAIIEREPSNAQALNALGYTLADRTDRYSEALEYIERAMKVEPGDAAIIDSMGWVHYRMGNHAKAVELLRQAMELIKDPEIAAHLGEVLWEMGNKQGALEVWEDSLQQHPEHKILLDVMKRFG